ncbi:hypothetical protein BJ508DRAFT_10672 [Ascobolus immersus RN42]|uniref:Uncharacterized protein n=1 Tax=Ascobolus immersus RN42 TaxID=1160509 RepID=A0A3N4HQS7_ASCIM|nr:hypothetical protein BJ508DRAFT_10672 [Ascobolus immersus RN42]
MPPQPDQEPTRSWFNFDPIPSSALDLPDLTPLLAAEYSRLNPDKPSLPRSRKGNILAKQALEDLKSCGQAGRVRGIATSKLLILALMGLKHGDILKKDAKLWGSISVLAADLYKARSSYAPKSDTVDRLKFDLEWLTIGLAFPNNFKPEFDSQIRVVVTRARLSPLRSLFIDDVEVPVAVHTSLEIATEILPGYKCRWGSFKRLKDLCGEFLPGYVIRKLEEGNPHNAIARDLYDLVCRKIQGISLTGTMELRDVATFSNKESCCKRSILEESTKELGAFFLKKQETDVTLEQIALQLSDLRNYLRSDGITSGSWEKHTKGCWAWRIGHALARVGLETQSPGFEGWVLFVMGTPHNYSPLVREQFTENKSPILRQHTPPM